MGINNVNLPAGFVNPRQFSFPGIKPTGVQQLLGVQPTSANAAKTDSNANCPNCVTASAFDKSQGVKDSAGQLASILALNLEQLMPRTLGGGGGQVSGIISQFPERAQNLDFRQDYDRNCGLATIANAGRMLGLDLTEEQVVAFTKANRLSNSDFSTTPEQLERILRGLGLKVQTQKNANMNDITAAAESGLPVILVVNSHTLNGEGGGNRKLNHGVTLLGVKKGANGQVEGYYIADTTHADADGVRFISADLMRQATNGNTVLQRVSR